MWNPFKQKMSISKYFIQQRLLINEENIIIWETSYLPAI